MFGHKKKLIAFTLYPGVRALDLVGPLTVLRGLALGSSYRTVVVAKDTQPVISDTSLRMIPAKRFSDVPTPFAVIVPGCGNETMNAIEDKSLIDYVRTAAKTAEIVGSTGSGALVLASAGLLQGRKAATHWAYGGRLMNMGTEYVRQRWVEDGRLFTSAGGSAGIDMMLRLYAMLKSESAARVAQLVIEYDPQPPFGGIDWSSVDSGSSLASSAALGPEV